MSLQPIPGPLTKRLEAAFRHWDERRIAARGRSPVPSSPSRLAFSVAISREAGTQGTAIAEEVGQRLNWPVYDHQLLDAVANEMGVRTKLLESIDERHTSWLLEDFQRAFGVPTIDEPAYVHCLAQTILALGLHGECVIVGHAAAQILSSACTMRVRLLAPRDHRIAVVARQRGMSPHDATQLIARNDRNHIDFVQENFHKDPTELHQYDQLLNTARYSLSQCAGLIVQGLRDLQANAAKQEEPST